MKKRLFITLLMVALFVCLFAISVSAENMSVYATAKVQTNDGVWHDVYCPSERWEGRIQLADGLYTTIDNTSDKIDPATVIAIDMSESVTYYLNGSEYKSTAAKNFYSAGKAFSNVKSVILSENTERIRGGVCAGWTALTEIYIPSKVHTIHNDAFNGCTNLKKVTIGSDSKLSSVMGQAFINCSSLESFTFPAAVTSISDNAFSGCSSLSKIVLSSPEISISGGAFRNCSKTITAYIVGDNSDDIISKLKGNSCFADHTEEIYVAGTEYTACFVTGYNYCEAYNSGNHTLSENYELSFTDYTTSFNEVSVCTVCGVKNNVNEEDFAPIFVFVGYSVKENDSSALCAGYTVNHNSMAVYKKYNANVTLSYGIVASTPNEDGSNLLKIGENGVEAAQERTNIIIANVNMDYVGYDFILRGFDEEGGNSDTALIICSYLTDGTNIYYLTKTCSSTVPAAITMTEIRKKQQKDTE